MSIEETERLCKSYGLQFKHCGGGHVQISNHGTLVNYWPLSKRQTAHIAGGESYQHMSPYDAVKLCLTNAKAGAKPSKRRLSKSKPQGDLKPKRAQRPAPKHLYDGYKPPWEYPGPLIACWSDIWRREAYELQQRADTLECAEAYQDAEPE